MPTIISIDDPRDPRLDDYRDVRDRQLLAPFTHADARTPDPLAPWGKFMIEGQTVFDKVALSTHRVLSVLCTPTRLDTIRPQLEALPDPAFPVYVVAPALLNTLVGFPLHRGLMAIAARARPLAPDEVLPLARPGAPIVALESLFNHDNIGSIFRSSAALGAAGVLLSPACADPLYRKALRVSVGCALLVPWAYSRAWPADLERLRASGTRVVAMALSPAAIDLRDLPARVDLARERVALLLGSEGPGLSPEALAVADVHVRIPMQRGVDSLNVGVAAGIALAAITAARP